MKSLYKDEREYVMEEKKVINSPSGLIISLILLALATSLGIVLYHVAHTLYVWNFGPFIRTEADFIALGENYLDKNPAVYFGTIQPKDDLEYLAPPFMETGKVVYYHYRLSVKSKNEDDDEDTYVIKEENDKSIGFTIKIGTRIFHPQLKPDTRKDIDHFSREVDEEHVSIYYLAAHREVLLFAQKHGNTLSPAGPFAPFITVNSTDTYKEQTIIGILVLAVFFIFFFIMGVLNLYSSINWY